MEKKTLKKEENTRIENRYFISSLKGDIEQVSRAVRGHWSIESMHWYLDVTFREDANTTIDKLAAQNLNIIRKWSLSILKPAQITRHKLSMRKKRFVLHFIIMDILSDGQERSLVDIVSQVDKYLSVFDHARVFDVSTIRKKLNEYVKEGLLVNRKNGKTMLYRRTEELEMPGTDVLDFFSETAPCGVIGSFLKDKTNDIADNFAFKHHYITGAMDSEVLCTILEAIHEKRNVMHHVPVWVS